MRVLKTNDEYDMELEPGLNFKAMKSGRVLAFIFRPEDMEKASKWAKSNPEIIQQIMTRWPADSIVFCSQWPPLGPLN